MLQEIDKGVYATTERDYFVVDVSDGYDVHRMSRSDTDGGAVIASVGTITDAAFAIKMDRGIPDWVLLKAIKYSSITLVVIAAWALIQK